MSGNALSRCSSREIQHLSRFQTPACLALAATVSSWTFNGARRLFQNLSTRSTPSRQVFLFWTRLSMTTSTSTSTSSLQSSSTCIFASSACKNLLQKRNFLPLTATLSMPCLTIPLHYLGCAMPLALALPQQEISLCSWSLFYIMLTQSFPSQHMVTMFLVNPMIWLMLFPSHRNFGLTTTSGQHTRSYVPFNAIECRHCSLRCSTLVSRRN